MAIMVVLVAGLFQVCIARSNRWGLLVDCRNVARYRAAGGI